MKETLIRKIINNMSNTETLWVIVKIIFILLITLIVSKIVNRIYSKSKLADKINFRFLKVIITWTIYLLGILACIYQIPAMSTFAKTLLAGSGILAAIVGLGAQSAFGNIISGLIISTSKPFDIGDRVIIKGSGVDITGYITDITLRHTVIRTYSNSEFILTNSQLDNMIIENTTRNNNSSGIVQFVDVSIAYEADIEEAIKIINDIVGNHKNFYDTRTKEDIANGVEKVTVRCRALASSGIDLRVSVRTHTIDESFSTCSDCRITIVNEFKKHNIEIPYTKITIV